MYTLLTDLAPENFINLHTYKNVNIIPLDNFALIPKDELRAILSSLDMPKVIKIDLDYYRIFTTVSKKDIYS